MPAIYGVILLLVGCAETPTGHPALICHDYSGAEVPCYADTAAVEAPGEITDPVNVPGGINL